MWGWLAVAVAVAGETPGPAVSIGHVSFSAGADGAKVLDVDRIAAGGVELRALHCTGVAGGLLGPAVLGAGLGAAAPALAACAPTGSATRVRWTWTGGHPTGVTVEAASGGAAPACVPGVLAGLAAAATWTATCGAVVLAGDPAGAAAALAGLGGS